MLKACKLFLGGSVAALVLAGCATDGSAPVTQDVEFRIIPDGTAILVTDQETGALLKSCQSPCIVTVDVTRSYDYVISREGMADKTGTLRAKFNTAGRARDFAERGTNILPPTYISGRMETDQQRDARLAAMPPQKRRLSLFREARESGDLMQAIKDRDVKPANCPPTDTFLKPGDLERLAMIPPIMPFNATRSGHCMVRFDVNVDGEPVNVNAASCSEDLFEPASVAAVSFWLFEPKTENGQAVPVCGVEAKMSFMLQNEIGVIIPEKN